LTLEELRKLGELFPIPEELSAMAGELAKLPPPDFGPSPFPPGSAFPPASSFPKFPPLPRIDIQFGQGGKKAQP
ncbi:MAG TPA: hypothetical protein VGP93_18780, partial [Polyangiaceae bacterium]|nr:hypothetical protein [Polyangiaceae bacterium]